MSSSDGLKFQCTFFGDNGHVMGLKVFDATEQPGNRVIKYETLFQEIVSAEVGGGPVGSLESIQIKCGNLVIESDEQVNKIVANAVIYGQVNVELSVDLVQRSDWELVDSASQLSCGNDNEDVDSSNDTAVKDGAVDATDTQDDDVGKTCDVTAGIEDSEDSGAKAAVDVAKGEQEAVGVVAANDDTGLTIDNSVQPREHCPQPASEAESVSQDRGCVDDHQNQASVASNTNELETAAEAETGTGTTRMEDADQSGSDGRKTMATLGCFGTDSVGEALLGDPATSQGDTLSEWTNQSALFKQKGSPAELSDEASDYYMPSNVSGLDVKPDETPDVVEAAIRDVEKALESGEDVFDKHKLTQLLSTINVIIKEILKSNQPEGTGANEFDVDDEDDISIFTRVKLLLRDKEVVEAFQRLCSSSVVKEFIVDVATNDVSDVFELNSFLLNHLGDILPEVGTLLRSVPQVLSLVPVVLSRWSELLSSLNKGDDPEAREGGQKPVHENILCDGCEQSESRRDASKSNGNISGTYICGVRYKSAIKPDFDLCESCEASGEFEEEYSPFLKIRTPEKSPSEIVCVLPAQKNKEERTFRESAAQAIPAAKSEEPKVSTGLVCPEKGHPLRRFHVPNRLFACDVCDSRPEKGSLMFGCRICDWDMCERCVRKNCYGKLPGEVEGPKNEAQCPQRQSVGASCRRRVHPVPRPVIRPQRPVAHGGSGRNLAARINADHPGNKPRAKFVADVSIPDGAVLSPGTSFTKIWRVLNASENVPWPNGCRIVCVGGDMMGASPEGVLVPPVPPGEVGDICVQLRAPRQAGRCFGYWRLITPATAQNPGGKRFGQRFWVDFTVADNAGASHQRSSNEQASSSPHNEMLRKWDAEIRQLAEMEFLDVARNITLLEEEDGNLTKVIEKLVLD